MDKCGTCRDRFITSASPNNACPHGRDESVPTRANFIQGSTLSRCTNQKDESMIRAIIFDIGGVLIDDPSTEMVNYYAGALGVPQQNCVNVLRKVWDVWHTGQITEQEVWRRMSSDLHIPPYNGDALWLKGFKHAYRERPEMFALLTQLKQQGYTIALLSNTEPPIMQYLKEHPYEHVDVGFYSCEIGISKPAKAIYERVLQQLAVQPQEAIFIDDRQENVDSAISVGIHGFLFRGIDNLKQQLFGFTGNLNL